MKPHCFLIVLFIFAALVGCKKSDGGNPPSIVAKWELVNDSAIYHNTPTGFTTNYNGVPGDYFDFRPDNKCYTKEGNKYDTLSYKLLTDTTAIIQGFGIYGLSSKTYYSLIKPLTDHNATITSPDLLVPAASGGSHRIVNLKK